MIALSLPLGEPGRVAPGLGYPVHRGCGGALLLREQIVVTRLARDEQLGTELLVCGRCERGVEASLELVLRARDAALDERGVGAWPRVWCGGPAEPRGAPFVAVDYSLTLPSPLNVREHHRVRSARVQAERDATAEALTLPAGALPLLGPWCCRLIRLGRAQLDSDNLGAAFKEVRDTIAAALHCDDGSPLYGWAYAQGRGPGTVRIEIWGAGGVP